jgi:hypothetical protein
MNDNVLTARSSPVLYYEQPVRHTAGFPGWSKAYHIVSSAPVTPAKDKVNSRIDNKKSSIIYVR